MYGCLYKPSFNPINPYLNLIVCDDGGGGYNFSITRNFKSNESYILVVTTYNPNVTGPYSIVAEGPSDISIGLIIPTTTSTVSSKELRDKRIS